MESTRRARIESVIREEISLLLAREIKDPRIPTLTLTQVQLTPDAGLATILFVAARRGAVNPDTGAGAGEMPAKQLQECMAGLQSSSGFMRRHLSKVLTLRQVPALTFKEDRGLQNTERVNELLAVLKTENQNKPE